MKKREIKTARLAFLKLSFLVIGLILFTVLIRALSASLFFHHPDRINILIYGERTMYFSVSTADSVNYVFIFYPDLKILVPGGYGEYRVGALGKLISLEKKPELFEKAFSSATSSFTNYYFYSGSSEVYYGVKTEAEFRFPLFKQLFLSHSNASFLDRMYLYVFFLTSKKSDYNIIDQFKIQKRQDEKILSVEDLAKRYQGFFYQKSYRDEDKTVQIIYTIKYKSAQLISSILEGNGIRVVDISQDVNSPRVCLVIEATEHHSKTAIEIASFFSCELKNKKTTVSDILFELGNRENDWSLK